MMSKTDRFLKREIEKDGIASVSEEDFLPATERADLFLPVATVVTPVSPESRIVVHSDPRCIGADRFRLARIRLKSLQASKGLRTLLITSPMPGDGKSTVSLNLATALSENGKQPVLLIEARCVQAVTRQKAGDRHLARTYRCYQRSIDPMLAIRRVDPWAFIYCPWGGPPMMIAFCKRNLPRN